MPVALVPKVTALAFVCGADFDPLRSVGGQVDPRWVIHGRAGVAVTASRRIHADRRLLVRSLLIDAGIREGTVLVEDTIALECGTRWRESGACAHRVCERDGQRNHGQERDGTN